MKITRFHVLLILFSVAFFLRVWRIGDIPVSLNWDEVAFGYNAYSLSVDARDEFGVLLPYKYLESFGDFKPPLYAYLTIPSIKVFGLTEFAVRFPSALFGTLTVLLTFFLTRRIFHKHKQASNIALISTALLAFSPWHVNLSRAAFEANVATFFIVLGVYLLLRAVQNKAWILVASAVSFSLSFYIFNTARIVSPLLALSIGAIYWRSLLANKKAVIVSAVAAAVFLIPLVGFLTSPQAALRYQEVNIFSDLSVIERTNQQIARDDNAWWSKIIHNRRLAYGVEYIKHYMDNFTPAFLFIDGDENLRFGTKDIGLLYMWELPFLIAGTILLFRNRESVWWLIPVWVIIGIIPAATARETPHALRILTIIPTLQIITAYGLYNSYVWFRKLRLKNYLKPALTGLFGCIVLVNIVYYLHGYYSHYPAESASEWIAPYKESIQYVQKVENRYEKIAITTGLGRPYIYYLFYNQTDPQFFRSTVKIRRDAFGFVYVDSYGKYVFDKNPVNAVENRENVLFIDMPNNVPQNANIQQRFYLPDGSVRLIAFTL